MPACGGYAVRDKIDFSFGAVADVRGLSAGIKIAAVFAAGLMPWPKHFSLKIFGR